jgi:hypothetical protein
MLPPGGSVLEGTNEIVAETPESPSKRSNVAIEKTGDVTRESPLTAAVCSSCLDGMLTVLFLVVEELFEPWLGSLRLAEATPQNPRPESDSSCEPPKMNEAYVTESGNVAKRTTAADKYTLTDSSPRPGGAVHVMMASDKTTASAHSEAPTNTLTDRERDVVK